MAKSPRTPAVLRSGAAGAASYGQRGTVAADPTAGRHDASTAGAKGRRKYNTMRNTRHGGASVYTYVPAEVARDRDLEPAVTAPTPVRTSGRRLDSGSDGWQFDARISAIGAVRQAGIGEGFRRRAMTDRSLLITTGAIRIDPVARPVWMDRP